MQKKYFQEYMKESSQISKIEFSGNFTQKIVIIWNLNPEVDKIFTIVLGVLIIGSVKWMLLMYIMEKGIKS